MDKVFFDSWSVLLRTLVIGVLAYVGLIILLRISKKRTLSKMNAFDFIVTIALGSTLASMLTSKDVSLTQGIVAFGLLIGLQFIITWLSVRIGWVRRAVTGEPTMLLYRGNPLPDAMRRERITESEVQAAIREKGLAQPADVEAVVLETDGTLSVISRSAARGAESVIGVKSPAARAKDGGGE